MVQIDNGLGGSMKLNLVGMRVDALGSVSPSRRLWQCGRGKPGTQ